MRPTIWEKIRGMKETRSAVSPELAETSRVLDRVAKKVLRGN
jgi:hypothetical protein